MIRHLDLRGRSSSLDKSMVRMLIPRAALSIDTVMPQVQTIIEKVKNGDEVSVLELGRGYDGAAPPSIRVPGEVMRSALEDLDPGIKEALERSIERIKRVHQDQVRDESTVVLEDGATVTERWIPVDRVALYVPGGRAVYPSSAMMNVIPAQIAKVPSIAILSPAQSDNQGWPHPTILATAAAALILSERLLLNQYAGGGLVLAALVASSLLGKWKK